MTGRVAGKVAFITGIARGQGRSHAVRLAEEGADIIGIDVCRDLATIDYPGSSPDDLAGTVELVERLDRRIIVGEADIRDGAATAAVLDRGVAELGRLDIVSANAAIFSHGSTLELTDQQWTELIDVNLTGTWRTCRAAIPHLLAGARGGSIVITSSVAGLKPYQNVSHYVAAKHGTVGLMRSLALELAPHFIRVNSIHPTTVDTPMVQNDDNYRLFRPDLDHPGREDIIDVNTALNAMPIPWVQPVDISNALLFLASDEARYITGATLPVDAGCSIAPSAALPGTPG